MQYRHLGTLRKTGGSALPNAAAQILEKAAREKTAAAGVLRLPRCPEQSKERGANDYLVDAGGVGEGMVVVPLPDAPDEAPSDEDPLVPAAPGWC